MHKRCSPAEPGGSTASLLCLSDQLIDAGTLASTMNGLPGLCFIARHGPV